MSIIVPNGHKPMSKEVEEADAERRTSVADVLARMANEEFLLFANEDGQAMAVPVSPAKPNVALPIRGSNGLRQHLTSMYYQRYGRAAGQSALTDATAALEAAATVDGARIPVHLRSAWWHDEDNGTDHLIIDMGTQSGEAIKVTPGSYPGYEVISRSPVIFRRTALTGELVAPALEPDFAPIYELVNAADDQVDLLLAWMAAAYIPDVPRPLLFPRGEQGTGKSSLAKLVVNVIDPSPAPLHTMPADLKSWASIAKSGYLVALDNVSRISADMSDALCRAITGDSFVDRALFTDEDLAIRTFQRAIILTSIGTNAIRGDLAERMLPIELETIAPANRRAESALWNLFNANRGHILGAVLTVLAQGLNLLEDVEVSGLGRMADFERFLANVDDERDGWQTLATYRESASDMADDVIEGDVFASAIVKMVEARGEWSGDAADLIVDVKSFGDPWAEGWPKTPKVASGRLNRVAPALRKRGIDVSRRKSNGRKLIVMSVGV